MKNADDQGVRMLWLADKLANIRPVAGNYTNQGDKVWKSFHQRDPGMHHWYCQTIAKQLELSLTKTGAFKEFIKHINFIRPPLIPKRRGTGNIARRPSRAASASAAGPEGMCTATTTR